MSATASARGARRRAVRDFKRRAILEAARAVFAEAGLDGATVRAIAQRAGYAPGAIYLYYDGKERIYADLLADSLDALDARVRAAGRGARSAGEAARRTLRAFFEHYRAHPDELELGLYLFQGARRRGLSPDLDRALNARLAAVIEVMAARLSALGLSDAEARLETTGLGARVIGALILDATGRFKVFGVAADAIVDRGIDDALARATSAGKEIRHAAP